MELNRRSFCAALGTLTCTTVPGLRAQEGSYPSRPITLVVTTPAGGVTDTLFRQLGDSAKAHTGQPFVVENRPGGGSLVALNHLRNQRPDGYTISMIGRSVLSQYWINDRKIGFHPIEDLTWISRINGSAFAIVVRADSPDKSWADIVARAKSKPGALNYGGFTAVGGMTHVAVVDAARKDGLQMQYVPYKGDTDALQALLSGSLDFAVVAGSFRSFAESGRVRPVAFLTEQRVPQFPQVPTLIELGYPVTIDASVGIAGPKGMPKEVVAYLEDVFKKAIQAPAFATMLDRTMQMPTYLDHQGFTAWAGKQLEVEREIVERFSLRAQK